MKISKTFLIILFICLTTRINAQTPDFYPMDDNFELIQKFYKTDTVIVVFPDTEQLSARDKQDIKNFVFWGKKPFFSFKKESDIVPKDLEKHLQLFGAIFNFKKVYSPLPVKISTNGFLYKTESFNKDNDAFYYLNDNAKILYTCKNSVRALNPFSIYGVGAYQFYVFSDYNICYSGFFNQATQKENVNDVCNYKKQYFQQKTISFFNLNIAKTLNVDSTINVLSDKLDNYVINLCNYLKVDTNNIDKIDLYIYADRIELQKFIAAPLWSTVWGKCMGNVLHTSNLNLSTIKHETAHSIIFQKIGYYANPFFDEGFRQYTEYLFNDEVLNSDKKITKANLQLLNNELLNSDVKFFNNQQNYCISGIFIKYLIDKIGLSEFKAAFSQRIIEEYIGENYKMSINEIITEFKNTL